MSETHPAGHVFYRRERHPHPTIAHGEGVYLYDTDGRRYLDGSGGALVVNIGHGVREVADAIGAQAAQAAYLHATMFTSRPLEAYAQALAALVPLPAPRFYFMCSGSEAVESAIKLARQVQLARGQAGRYLVISRWGSYHGATLGALAVTGKPKMRRPFQPMLPAAPHIPAPYCYRCPYGSTYPDCGLRCADALEQEIQRVGPEHVAAFIAEPVSGATLGAVVPPPEYWPRIRQICDAYGLLLIADEVMSGCGRSGRWFALQHWGVTPDLMTIGKGASGGYFPLSITAVKGEWVDALLASGAGFVHGGTFSHHAVGAAAGLATLNYLQAHGLVAAAARLGERLGGALRAALEGLPCVGDVRGLGLMWGVEFVADRATKAPFPAGLHFAQQVADAALARGLIVYPGSGCADGDAGDLVLIGPPFTITADQIDELVSLLREAIEAVLAGMGSLS
jgi:adenosylmethionine-8-amino-7-oxononanoate aminotransferase